jgi:CDP-diacylglycerol---glycerol-3-phosphate 3-phosphatidyltransferase
LVRKLAQRGVTANQVTIAAVILSLMTGGLLICFASVQAIYWLVPFVMLLRMALNAIDGMLAREHQMQSKLGQLLNELGDVVSDAALFLPFALVSGIKGEWIVGIVVLAIVSEFTGVLGQVIGASRRYDGPMGKSDRAALFGLLAILIALGVPLAVWSNWLLMLVLILIVWNIFRRARRALQEVQA